MLSVNKLKRVTKVMFKPQNFFGQAEYVFIVSHMRSRSSLLAHILGSHPEICGYHELHRSYVTRFDLLKMRLDLLRSNEGNLKNKILLDKILHNEHTLEPSLMSQIPARIIYLLREPVGTLNSYLGLAELTGNSGYLDAVEAEQYYSERLEFMISQHGQNEVDTFFVDSDDLVLEPNMQLRRVAKWLGLDSPLEKNYMVFEKTGNQGAGDPSNNIRFGQIKRRTNTKQYEIEAEIVTRCMDVFSRCKETLKS